jgi:cytochrome c
MPSAFTSFNILREVTTMKRQLRLETLAAVAATVIGLFASTIVLAANATTAEELAQQSGCFKCHAVAKKKDGPTYKDVAAKYKGDADAEKRLIFHITSGEKVKFDDGHEEKHKIVKSKDEKEIKNLADWILSLEGGTKS